MKLQSFLTQTCTLNGHLYRVIYTRFRIDTINSPDDVAHGCPKHVKNRNKHTRNRIVRQVGYLQILHREARSTEHKIPFGRSEMFSHFL
jgi:hypothetical protein